MDTGGRPQRGPLHALQSFTVEAERYMEVARRHARLGHNDVHALSAIIEAAREGVVMTPGALRRRLVLSPAATTALVDRLVSHGLLRREKASTDGRTVELWATDQARLVGREMFVVLSESIMGRLAAYSPAEQEQFISMIHDMTDAAQVAREQLEGAGVAAEATTDEAPDGESPPSP